MSNIGQPILSKTIPRHVAIIMDGNGRWAKKRGLPRLAGHKAGTENLRRIIKACVEFGIEYLTIYAFSTENWGRPREEVAGLPPGPMQMAFFGVMAITAAAGVIFYVKGRWGGLFSFLCWTYKPYGTALGGREVEPREYWRHMALSRIFLDNVKHFRTSVLTQNEEAFRALDYGADDFDLPIEDEVTQKAGATIELDLEGLLAVPRKLGYTVEYRRAERPAALTA